MTGSRIASSGVFVALVCALLAATFVAIRVLPASGLAAPTGPLLIESAGSRQPDELYVAQWRVTQPTSWEALWRDRGLTPQLAQESFFCTTRRNERYEVIRSLPIPSGTTVTLVLRSGAACPRPRN